MHINTPSEHANCVVTDKDRDGVSGISKSQWKAIVSLLNADKPNKPEKLSGKFSIPFWIMNIGASHHLTGRLEILSDVRSIPPVVIVLTDVRERISDK